MKRQLVKTVAFAGIMALNGGSTGAADTGFLSRVDLTPPISSDLSNELPRYLITDLGTLGGESSAAFGINNHGAAVGYAQTYTGDYQPFVYFPGPCEGFFCLSGMLDIDLMGEGDPTGLTAVAIDDDFHVVGNGLGPDDQTAFHWDLNTSELAVFYYGYMLEDIENGVAVGWKPYGDEIVSFRWGDGVQSIGDIGTLGGDTVAYGTDGFAVVGESISFEAGEYYEGQSRAFLWRPDTLTPLAAPEIFDLEMLHGGTSSSATDVVRNGTLDFDVVGDSDTGFGTRHAVLWDVHLTVDNNTGQLVKTIELTDLGTLSGYEFSEATAINRNGEIVGRSWTNALLSLPQAIVWNEGVIENLNDLISESSPWELLIEANDINEAGQIVGAGYVDTNNDGQWERHAFLMTPCKYTISPASLSVTSSGGTYTATVTAPDGCAWTASIFSDNDFIFIQDGNSGNGNGEILFNVTSNGSTSLRNGNITINPEAVAEGLSATLSILQSGVTPTLAPRTSLSGSTRR